MERKVLDLLLLVSVGERLATKDVLNYLGLEPSNSNSKRLAKLIREKFSNYLEPTQLKDRRRGYKVVKVLEVEVVEVIEQQALEQVEEIKPTEQQQFLDIARNNLQQALKEHSWKLVGMYSKYIRQNL